MQRSWLHKWTSHVCPVNSYAHEHLWFTPTEEALALSLSHSRLCYYFARILKSCHCRSRRRHTIAVCILFIRKVKNHYCGNKAICWHWQFDLQRPLLNYIYIYARFAQQPYCDDMSIQQNDQILQIALKWPFRTFSTRPPRATELYVRIAKALHSWMGFLVNLIQCLAFHACLRVTIVCLTCNSGVQYNIQSFFFFHDRWTTMRCIECVLL